MCSKSLGNSIRARWRQKGMTIEKLAEKVGVSPTFLGSVERGSKMPSMKTFIKIVEALELPRDYIFSKEIADKRDD